MTMAERRSNGISLGAYFFAFISIFSVVTLFLNAKHSHAVFEDISTLAKSLSTSYTLSTAPTDALNEQESSDEKQSLSTSTTQSLSASITQSLSASITELSTKSEQVLGGFQRSYSLAGLSCEKYGGPAPDIAQEMVYWEDIASDNQHVSPLKRKGVSQYLTFEPDKGGWNNIR
jgi:hypothetical protein